MELKWKADQEGAVHIRKKGEVVYLTYPALEEQPGFCHGFSTRLGGVSRGIFSSMNLSFTRGDEEQAVLENYRRMADALGFSLEKAVCSDQTHTANVRYVTLEDAGKGIVRKKDYTDVDGLVTDVPGLTLVTSYADCVPLFFVDPVRRAVGLSHSGWRGTVGKIGAVTVRKMQEVFGSDPRDILAAIGPSICQDCYEVSEDVAQEFKQAFARHSKEKQLLYRKEDGKYQLNLWRANELVLLEVGILSQHISFPGLCTCCNPDFLFSHWASHGKRGNLSAFLGIRESIE